MEDRTFEHRIKISGKVKSKLPIDSEINNSISEYGINPSVLNYPLQKVVINSTKGDLSGLGCSNINGGIEFFSPIMNGRTITVGTPGLIMFKKSKKRNTKECYLLDNMIDYLALRTLQHEGHLAGKYPVFADYMILNDVRNVLSFICESEVYDIVHSMLPHTDAGLILTETMKVRNPHHVTDDSDLYDGFESISKYLYNKKNNESNGIDKNQ